MQKASSTELLPKLYSVQNVIVSLGFGLSTILFGWIAEMVHVQAAFFIAGGVLIISFVCFCKKVSLNFNSDIFLMIFCK